MRIARRYMALFTERTTMRISDSAVKTAPTAAYAVQLFYNVNLIFYAF